MIYCKVCKSTDVEVLAWVDANTLKYKDQGPDSGDGFCNNCKKEVSLIDTEEINLEDNGN